MSTVSYTSGDLRALRDQVNAIAGKSGRRWGTPWQSDEGRLYAVSSSGYRSAPLTAHGKDPESLLADIRQVEADAARAADRAAKGYAA